MVGTQYVTPGCSQTDNSCENWDDTWALMATQTVVLKKELLHKKSFDYVIVNWINCKFQTSSNCIYNLKLLSYLLLFIGNGRNIVAVCIIKINRFEKILSSQ